MTTLFLDFASHKKSIGLVDDDRTIAFEAIDDNVDESAVMPMIETLLVKTKKIDRITVVTGPGGFMSLRVGLSIGNAFAWSLKVPIGGVHLSDVWSARAMDEKTYAWVHSTKKELVFIRGFGELKNVWPEPVLLSLADLQTQTNLPYIGELIETQAAALPGLKKMMHVQPLETVLPNIVKTLEYGESPIMPWYGRGA